MAIKGPELEIGIKANVDQVKTDLGTLATTLERIKKASDLRIDLDVPRQAKEKIAKLVNDIKKETQDISSIPLKFTEEGADALIAKLESTAGKLDTVIQKVALVNQHAKEAIESVGAAGANQKIENNAKAVRKLNDEMALLKKVESDKILASLDLDKFVRSAKDMVNLIEKITGMVKSLKENVNSIGDTQAFPKTSPIVEKVRQDNKELKAAAKEREKIIKSLDVGNAFDELDERLHKAGRLNLSRLSEGPEMHVKMVKSYNKLMGESNSIAGELLKRVASKDVGITEDELDKINNVVTALNKAAGQGAILKGLVASKGTVNDRLINDVKYQYDDAHELANALEKAGAEAIKRQPTITQATKATTEAKKEEQAVTEKVVEATKAEAKAQQEVAKAVKETAKEKQVASAKATESTTVEIGLQKELAKAIKDVASQQKKLAETIKSNAPVEKPAQNVVVQVQQENNEIQAALAKREVLLRRLNDTSRITSKRTYDRRMETLGGLNKTLNAAGYEELLPRFNRTTYGDDYYKEYVKEMSGYNAMQKEMNSLIERGIAPTRERWQAEKNRYDNMIAMLKAGKVISTKDFVDPTAGSYENFLGKIKEHQKAVSGISLNLTQFNEQVGTVIAKLEQVKAKGNIPVHLDTTGLKDALNNLNISVDSTAFHKKIAELRKSIDKLEPFKLAINADATQFNSVVDNCLKKLKELRDTNVTIITQTREVAKGSNGTPKKEAKEKSKKEIDYDKVLAMLKANPNTNGIVKGNSTVGARLSKVKVLQSAAMLEGGWQPNADDLAWLANERNVLERKNEAVKLNNTRPGKNLIDEYIRQREQEAKAFREKLERQMNEEVKAEAEARKRRLAQEAQAAKEQKEYSDRTAKLLVQEKFAQTKEQEKAERDRLDANNKQLRENLKAWQKNNEAIERAKKEANNRRLAKEAQEAKRQKEYSDRTTALNVKEKMQEIQNENKVAKAEKLIANRWQQFDMLDNVTPKAYLSMFQFLDKQISKIESLGGKYTGRILTKTPEEYKTSYVPPSSGLDESARKQQKIRDIAFAYSQELARQNQLIQSGVEIKQKDIEASERRITKLKRDWEQAGATQELRKAPLVGRDAQEVNRTRAVNNAMAWQNSYYSTASSKVSSLTSSLERLYTELNRNPGNAGIKQYIVTTTKELSKARKEAKDVSEQMKVLQGDSFKGWGHKLRWIGGALGFYESYDVLRQFGETITQVETGMANLATVMPDIHHSQQAMVEEQKAMIDTAAKYGETVDSVIESARLWGRMYKDRNTVNLLAEQSARLAVADNFSLEESTKAVEAAMFQFGLQAKSSAEAVAYSNRIIDVYTKLSHNAGVSAQDLAAAVERSGSVAHQAGMDFEFLTALIAQGTRATALSGLTNNSPFMLETA